MADRFFDRINLEQAGAEDRLNQCFDELFGNITAENIADKTITLNKLAQEVIDTIERIQAATGETNSHSLLINLDKDDHSQYLNVARHDITARHPLSVLDTLVASEAEVDSKISDHAGLPNAHIDNLTDITTRNHSDLQSIGVNNHHNKAHASTHEEGGNDEIELALIKNSTIFTVLGNEVFSNDFKRVRI